MHEPGSQYLTQEQLSARYGIAKHTLENWRWLRIGPPFTKIGSKVLYAMTDVLKWEQSRRQTTEPEEQT